MYSHLSTDNYKSRFFKYFLLTTSVCVFFNICLTESRAAILAGILGCSILGFPHIHLQFVKRKIPALLFLASIIILGMAALYLWKTDSVIGRLFIWKISIRLFMDYPLFGIGPNHYTYNFGHNQADYFQSGRSTIGEERIAGLGEFTFNEYLGIAVNMGIVGLGLVLLIIYFLVRGSLDILVSRNNKKNTFLIGCIGSLASILLFAFFSYPLSVLPICIHLVLICGILSSNLQDISKSSIKKRLIRWFVCITFPVTVALLYHYYNYAQNLVKWQQAIELEAQGKLLRAQEQMTKLYNRFDNNPSYLVDYGSILFNNKKYLRAEKLLSLASQKTTSPYLYEMLGQCQQINGKVTVAAESFIFAHYLLPYRFKPKYLLWKLYLQEGQKDKAKSIAKEIVSMPVKVETYMVTRMRREAERFLKESSPTHLAPIK
ncbi:hypothetical protein FKX85_02715 [Echinicola soli]|uniref:O-antigen ligase-related domain-containing protein n=1 Tax=Echinicola soli TaxID=2591634 RepID=A0A514CDV6_9BACT|nr:O-antigen ligase family protein [Echinicola soli]QDH78005.1 hypothetical protein FKX85_02715 [Echinicola soli]